MKLELLPLVRTQGGHWERGDRTGQDAEEEEDEEEELPGVLPPKEEAAVKRDSQCLRSVFALCCSGKLSATAFIQPESLLGKSSSPPLETSLTTVIVYL